MCVYVCVCVCVYVYMFTCICVYMCMYICMCVYVYIYHVYMYIIFIHLFIFIIIVFSFIYFFIFIIFYYLLIHLIIHLFILFIYLFNLPSPFLLPSFSNFSQNTLCFNKQFILIISSAAKVSDALEKQAGSYFKSNKLLLASSLNIVMKLLLYLFIRMKHFISLYSKIYAFVHSVVEIAS